MDHSSAYNQITKSMLQQDLKKYAEPYISKVATAAKPSFDKLHAASKPYIREVVPAYKKFIISASEYHYQVLPFSPVISCDCSKSLV